MPNKTFPKVTFLKENTFLNELDASVCPFGDNQQRGKEYSFFSQEEGKSIDGKLILDLLHCSVNFTGDKIIIDGYQYKGNEPSPYPPEFYIQYSSNPYVKFTVIINLSLLTFR